MMNKNLLCIQKIKVRILFIKTYMKKYQNPLQVVYLEMKILKRQLLVYYLEDVEKKFKRVYF